MSAAAPVNPANCPLCGKPFTKQTIYKMLHNRMYLGELGHKGEYFRGQHEADRKSVV